MKLLNTLPFLLLLVTYSGVSAQEVINSTHVKKWCEEKATHENVLLTSIGKSKLGKDLWFLDIYDGEPKKRDVIVLLNRQHPPEVTGYLAMQAFIDELLSDHFLAKHQENLTRKRGEYLP